MEKWLGFWVVVSLLNYRLAKWSFALLSEFQTKKERT